MSVGHAAKILSKMSAAEADGFLRSVNEKTIKRNYPGVPRVFVAERWVSLQRTEPGKAIAYVPFPSERTEHPFSSGDRIHHPEKGKTGNWRATVSCGSAAPGTFMCSVTEIPRT